MESIKLSKRTEGYVWWSNKNAPTVYRNGKAFYKGTEIDDIPQEMTLTNGENPFIVEGQLYDKDAHKSYSIKFVDGKYICKDFDIAPTDISNDVIDEKEYLSNRMDGLWLKFLRYWKEEEDELCENMKVKVLTFEKNVFFGFKEKEEDKI